VPSSIRPNRTQRADPFAPGWPARWLALGAARAAGHVAAYAAWIAAFRLVALTLITYVMLSSSSRFQEISDAWASNELMLFGLGALLYLLLQLGLNPITSSTADEIFTPHRFEKRFAPGFVQGAGLASAVALAFLIGGSYRYLGSYVQFEDAPLAIANVCLRIATLGCLAYAEEYLFRHKIMNYLRWHLPDLYAAAATGLAYCVIKALQFDLGLSHLLTLFLISIALSIRTISDGDFVRGAGLWAGLLIVFHPLLSLPVLGNEFQGVMIVKYQAAAEEDGGTARLLTGGAGGPLSSVALQLILCLDIVQGIVRNKKILWNARAARLK
jgi:hypothetical protein